MYKYIKLFKIVVVIIAFILCVILFLEFDVDKPGPDSVLYRGLALNLISRIGFVDNIRYDEILPPIGHPFLLALLTLFGINARYFIFISIIFCIIIVFALLYMSTHSFLLSAIGCTLYLFFCPDVFIQDGIEVSLFLFGTIWLALLICTIYFKRLECLISFGMFTVVRTPYV